MTQKFKVGDKVRRIKDTSLGGMPVGGEYEVVQVSGYDILVKGDESNWRVAANFELVSAAGPVREVEVQVTRKEIVQGDYGIVRVDRSTDVGRVHVLVRQEAFSGGRTAAELRAAAEVFTQLADALEAA